MVYSDKELIDECFRRPRPKRWAPSALYFPPNGSNGIKSIGIFQIAIPPRRITEGSNPYQVGTKYYKIFECHRAENIDNKELHESCLFNFMFPTGVPSYFPPMQVIFINE